MTQDLEQLIPIEKWSPAKSSSVVESFLQRPPIDPKAELVAKRTLSDIEAEGDDALIRYIQKFDRAEVG
ncbi:MAG: hypothetical protein AAF492_27240 [Verrucomicrobiota bacterium]